MADGLKETPQCADGDRFKTRRRFVLGMGVSVASLAFGSSIVALSTYQRAAYGEVGSLQAPDENGVRLPMGFSSNIVARSGRAVVDGYRWHIRPDGGATFSTEDGGWIYVSNAETSAFLGGGVSAIRFGVDGSIQDAYRILSGSNRNCNGGSTPWGTWLSCEEIDLGRVFECDPHGVMAAVPVDALGHFKHEAVAVDTKRGHLYMTEDRGDGRLYRFVPASIDPDGVPDWESGVLQVAQVDVATNTVQWLDIPEPCPDSSDIPTRNQVLASTAFKSAEGIWYHEDTIYFTTKGDERVWGLRLDNQKLTVVYDAQRSTNPVLTGPDDIIVYPTGNILVAEDGGDMQIVSIDTNGGIAPLLQVVGQDESEITGLAFSPDGTRLYFSSQRGGRGAITKLLGLGLTYEVTGPFSTLFSLYPDPGSPKKITQQWARQ